MSHATVCVDRMESLFGGLVPAGPRLRWTPRAGRALGQGFVVTGATLAYFGARSFTEGRPATAMANAAHVMSVERFLHLDVERSLQRLVVDRPAVTRALNWVYIFGHWPVIAGTLLWLVLTRPELYVRTRNALLLSGGVGLVSFAAFPVAPPRLAEPGLVDTVTRQSSAYRVLQPPAFTNQYAAMPSLHVGWNLLMTTAILAATRNRWIRAGALTLTLTMDATVVLTANHYLVDGIAGAALVGVSWQVSGRLQQRRQAGTHRPQAARRPAEPIPSPVPLLPAPPPRQPALAGDLSAAPTPALQAVGSRLP